MALVDTALARCEANGERFAVPELLRLKARIVGSAGAKEDARIALLEGALALSREQGARAWELRVAADLAASDPRSQPD